MCSKLHAFEELRPHLVAILAVCPRRLWMVMELVHGGSLAGQFESRLKRSSEGLRVHQPLPVVFLEMMRQLAAFLNLVEKRGIMHRDIKGDNVFVVVPDLASPVALAKAVRALF